MANVWESASFLNRRNAKKSKIRQIFNLWCAISDLRCARLPVKATYGSIIVQGCAFDLIQCFNIPLAQVDIIRALASDFPQRFIGPLRESKGVEQKVDAIAHEVSRI